MNQLIINTPIACKLANTNKVSSVQNSMLGVASNTINSSRTNIDNKCFSRMVYNWTGNKEKHHFHKHCAIQHCRERLTVFERRLEKLNICCTYNNNNNGVWFVANDRIYTAVFPDIKAEEDEPFDIISMKKKLKKDMKKDIKKDMKDSVKTGQQVLDREVSELKATIKYLEKIKTDYVTAKGFNAS